MFSASACLPEYFDDRFVFFCVKVILRRTAIFCGDIDIGSGLDELFDNIHLPRLTGFTQRRFFIWSALGIDIHSSLNECSDNGWITQTTGEAKRGFLMTLNMNVRARFEEHSDDGDLV